MSAPIVRNDMAHNRKTIEAGDALYGVTLKELGSSRCVPVNLTDSDGR